MPEAAIDKQYDFVFWENQVWLSGQVFVVQSVSEPLGKKVLPHQHFRFGVFRPDPAHIIRAGFGIVHVGHGSVFCSDSA